MASMGGRETRSIWERPWSTRVKRRGGKPMGDRAGGAAVMGDQCRRRCARGALSGAQVRGCVSRVQGAGEAVGVTGRAARISHSGRMTHRAFPRHAQLSMKPSRPIRRGSKRTWDLVRHDQVGVWCQLPSARCNRQCQYPCLGWPSSGRPGPSVTPVRQAWLPSGPSDLKSAHLILQRRDRSFRRTAWRRSARCFFAIHRSSCLRYSAMLCSIRSHVNVEAKRKGSARR